MRRPHLYVRLIYCNIKGDLLYLSLLAELLLLFLFGLVLLLPLLHGLTVLHKHQ